MSTLKKRMVQEFTDIKVLLRNIPSITVTVFILSVVCANLMANKELCNIGYLALDCGFAFSWLMFLCMDVICKRYGPKASIEVSVIALLVNLCVCGLFFLLSLTPGKWGEFYSFELDSVNTALNNTFGGAWYVVLGSGLAFLTSSVVNALLNNSLGKKLKKNNFIAFAFRSYISTMIAQFVDNFIFATVVSKIFFGWNWTQVIICSLIGAGCELLAEILFSGFGWKVVKSWDKDNVGNEYFSYMDEKRA
ncbi:MAG: VUT family protein [Treponema sp.]|nr:VUT family protein [Treponema sp.]